MFEYIAGLYSDFQSWVHGIWTDLVEFLNDLPIELLDSLLTAILSVIYAIPVPSFIQNNGLNTALNSLSPDILYFLYQSGFPSALGVVGLGFAFRMVRKLVTLFQW